MQKLEIVDTIQFGGFLALDDQVLTLFVQLSRTQVHLYADLKALYTVTDIISECRLQRRDVHKAIPLYSRAAEPQIWWLGT